MNNDDLVKLVIVAIAIVGFIIRGIVMSLRDRAAPEPPGQRIPTTPRRPRDAGLDQEIETFRRRAAAPPEGTPRVPPPPGGPQPVVVRSPAARPHTAQPIAAQVIPTSPPSPETPAQRPAPSPLAAGIFQWLANPESAQQLIVASEILHRPEHRWRF